MSLPIPIVGVDTGPDYALYNNSCFTILDGHTHAPGSGVQITPAGLNINADMPLNNNNLISSKTVRFQAQSSVPAVSPDLLCLYVVGNDIYYNDGAGNAVRITQSGSVSGASGTITGLPSGTASAAYSAVGGKFIFQSASNTGADIDGASIIIREKIASGHGVTISAPTSLAADYTLIMPAALPGTTRFLSLDSSGNVAGSIPTALGIDTANIANGAITGSKLAALGQQLSSSSGAYTSSSAAYVVITNLSESITTTGRPVRIELIPDGASSTPSYIGSTRSAGATTSTNFKIVRDGSTDVAVYNLHSTATGATVTEIFVPPGTISTVDPVAAGTYAYTVQMSVQSGSLGSCNLVKLLLSEIK